MGDKGGGGGTSTVKQDIPDVFKPAFTSLFNSAFGAARTSAGQDLGQRANTFYPQNYAANQMTGGGPLQFGGGGGGQAMINRQSLYSPLQSPQSQMGAQDGKGAGGQQPGGGVPSYYPGMQAQPGQSSIGTGPSLGTQPSGMPGLPAGGLQQQQQQQQQAPATDSKAGASPTSNQPTPFGQLTPEGVTSNAITFGGQPQQQPQPGAQDAKAPGGQQSQGQQPLTSEQYADLFSRTPSLQQSGMTLEQYNADTVGLSPTTLFGQGGQQQQPQTGAQDGKGGSPDYGGTQFSTNPYSGQVDASVPMGGQPGGSPAGVNVPGSPPTADLKAPGSPNSGANQMAMGSYSPGDNQFAPQPDGKGGGAAQFSGLPSGSTAPGSQGVPLASGPPIIGQPFGGPFTAGTSPLELEALQQREGVARQLGGLGNNMLNLGQAQAGGAFLDPSTNPFFTQNLQASLQPAMDAYSRSVMPQFNSQALQSGAFKGSSAREFAAGNLANDFGRNLMQTAAQQGMQNYMQERQIQQQTPQMLDAAARLNQLAPEILSQVGLGEREVVQRILDEALLQFQEQQQAPFRPLGPLANIIQGTNVGLNTTSQVPTPSALAQGISGALGGAGMGAGLADVMGWGGMGGGASVGLGGLLGTLAGALG